MRESRQVDLGGLYITPWRKDPDGNEYRCHYNPNVPPDGGYWVEYKPREPKLPLEPFKHFLVRAREEVWNIWSKDSEAAALPFWSEFSSSYPRRNEVTVEEVVE